MAADDEGFGVLSRLNDLRPDLQPTFSYNLSPEVCREYDRLENLRHERGLPSLAWQQEFEEIRNRTERLWRICPLRDHLRRYLRKPYLTPDRWDVVLLDWVEFKRLYETVDSPFRHTLSHTQKASFDVLIAWWEAVYSDPSLQQAARSYLEKKAETKSEVNRKQDLTDAGETARTNMSLYHSSCFSLFLNEFCPYTWRRDTIKATFGLLQSIRLQAAEQAATQQLSFATLGLSQNDNTSAYPEIFSNDILIRTDLSSSPGPRYLYSAREKKTIDFQGSKKVPPYVCISHTWGRWRTALTNIPGVKWRVPGNTKFTVQDVPDQLHQLGFEYVWFDLFCIPQDKEGDNYEIAQIEIANQAAIFRRAERCIAWITDVKSWDVLECALEWLSLKYMNVCSSLKVENFDQRLSQAARRASITLGGLMESGTSAGDEPAPWFSSLWTLQECVLCPDLHLYSGGWKRLEDRRGQAIPLRSFMIFIAQTQVCLRDGPIDQPFTDPMDYTHGLTSDTSSRLGSLTSHTLPCAVRQLLQLLLRTRLENVFIVASPTPILTNANIRQSTGDRAPAIMSALGVTDWYKDNAAQGRNQQAARLVCGLYPIEFVREVAQKYGYLFWESFNAELDVGNITNQNVKGSMLPFGEKTGWMNDVIGSVFLSKIDVVEHQAVSKWIVNVDGSVTMDQVGILMTSSDPIDENLRGVITIGRRPIFSEISRGLRSAAGSGCIYAVALYEDCDIQFGLLLESLGNESQGRKLLVKVGSYHIEDKPLPQINSVNWKVL
ncbi:hypothetical protein F4680DRAFT_27297 [Xylaria scruposa]|nr:hypothetical protein F4680DRAFT_27297 [Xylaria scruposa]